MENERFTVEWSENQKCFHIDTIQGIIKKNTEMYLHETNNEFSLLGIFNSHQRASEFIIELKKSRKIFMLEERIYE